MRRIQKIGALLLCLTLLLPLGAVPAEADAETVRIGWYEDSYHITGTDGARSGYAYEYEQAVAAYTGWSYEYVKDDWGTLLEELQNGKIDLMAALSYTEERAQSMLFSELPMGKERYYLYVDLADGEISASDFSSLNGKRIIVMAESVQAEQFSQWEQAHNIKTVHVNIDSMERAGQMIRDHEIDGVISTETPIWVEAGMSAIANVGGSEIYYGISRNRPDLKEKLDEAMRKMEYDRPFYEDELYRQYLITQSAAVLSGEEQKWLGEHGDIRVGVLTDDPGISRFYPETGALVGIVNDYIAYAADCLENQSLEFTVACYETQAELFAALHSGEIDMVFHVSQNAYASECNGLALSNTAWTLNLAALTAKEPFDESAANTVAVLRGDETLEWYLSDKYPQWKIAEYDSMEEVQKAVRRDAADCLVVRSSQVMEYIKGSRAYSIFLLQPNEVSFAVNRGNEKLLSILNKTLRAMPGTMLTGALSLYDSAARKVTLGDFVRDNLLAVTGVVLAVFFLVLLAVLGFLRRARQAAAQAQELNKKLQKSQEELQAALRQAEEANSAKTSFLFNMSHDIRTPMNAILGFTELAEKNTNDPAKIQDYLKKIQTSGKGMLSILDNVLELSRIESGKTTLEETPQVVGNAFDACLVMMNPEIEKRHHKVMVEKKLHYSYVYFDKPRVTEIILNLMSNAIKYTADGGTIHCAVTQEAHPEKGFVYQCFSITDNGIGMSEEYQKHIFESFSRERSTTLSGIQGTGLGMGIVKKLVDLMGGTISVKSRLGEGTTVSFRIPVKIASFEDTQPKHATVSSDRSRLKGKRILLAEDNDLNAEIAIALLQEEGLLVERAADGVECIEKMERAAPGYFTLILMDVQMPTVDGYLATEKIRKLQDKAKADIPIIAMTANAFSEDRAKALAVGMNDHVAKPIDMDVLVDTLLKYVP